MKYRLRHIAEYLTLRIFLAVFNFLPYRVALGCGWVVAAFGFHVVRWRRAEAERRIREVLADRVAGSEVRRIAWLSLRNFAFNAVEILLAPRLDHTWLKAHATYKITRDVLGEHVRKAEGAVLAVVHMGNWDAAGIAMELSGIPMLVIARSQKNPLITTYLNAQRSLHDSVVVDRDDSALLKKVQTWLCDGKVAAVLIYLRARHNASTFNFLGKQAHLGRGIGAIARNANCPIYPAITLRKGWTRHQWTLGDPIWPDGSLDRKTDSIRMTQECLMIFERVIQAHPEQYFWYNKRWVLEPLPKVESSRALSRDASIVWTSGPNRRSSRG
jgi:lauroyl/myristoyl acyltransferase